jgi:hypothetical protein
MIVGLSLSLVIPLSLGFILIHTLLPLKKRISTHFLLKISLAVGLGFGITSCIYFIALISMRTQIQGIILYEAVIFIFIVLMFIFVRHDKHHISSESDMTDQKALRDLKLKRILAFGFCPILVLALTNFLNSARRIPHGGWDAWAIWNMHARFIFRGGKYWTDAFSTLLPLKYHADYPLLLPLTVSRGWSFTGQETHTVPVLIALLFTSAIAGIIYSSLAVLRSRSQAILGVIVLLGATNFIVLGTIQYADIPIAFFFLASIVLLFYQENFPGNYRFTLFSGLMAGFAGWTKNEGLLFLFALFSVRIAATFFPKNRRTQIKQLIYFAMGSLPVLAIILYLKIYMAPSSEIIAGQDAGEIMAKLGESARYMQIAKGFLTGILFNFPHVLLLLFYLLYAGTGSDDKRKANVMPSLVVLVLMMMGYFAVYLVTPYNLDWHIESSLQRLLLQLWPSFIFVYFVIVRTPEEALIGSHIEMGSK